MAVGLKLLLQFPSQNTSSEVRIPKIKGSTRKYENNLTGNPFVVLSISDGVNFSSSFTFITEHKYHTTQDQMHGVLFLTK